MSEKLDGRVLPWVQSDEGDIERRLSALEARVDQIETAFRISLREWNESSTVARTGQPPSARTSEKDQQNQDQK